MRTTDEQGLGGVAHGREEQGKKMELSLNASNRTLKLSDTAQSSKARGFSKDTSATQDENNVAKQYRRRVERSTKSRTRIPTCLLAQISP